MPCMLGDPRRQCNINGIYKIAGCVTVVIILMIAVPLYYHSGEDPPMPYPCHIDLSVPLLNPQFHRNGSVVDHGDVYPSGFYFTVNGTTRGCICSLKPCIRKCCVKDEYLVSSPKPPARCEKNPETSPFDNFSLPVYASPGNLADVTRDHFRILYGDCPKFALKAPTQLMANGNVHRIIKYNISIYIDASKYCLDSFSGSGEIRVLLCAAPVYRKDRYTAESVMYTLYSIGMIISTVFLALTFLVYSILPEMRNLHGISLMCHSAALLTGYLFHAIIKIFQDDFSTFKCTLFAFIAQFSFLASFYWLNVMCFDIWLVISVMKPVQGRKHKKFLLYSLYAWGVPLIIVAVSVCVDLIPGVPDTWTRPRFGEQKCWFADNKGISLYFYLPIAVVVVTNIVMFVSTAFKLRAHTRSTKVLNTSESRRINENRDRFNLYLRLFIVMGVNWVMELVAFFVDKPESYLLFLPNIFNTLQGVFIFVIFVCKRKILKLLNSKLCPQWQIITDSSTFGTSASTGRSNVSNGRTKATSDYRFKCNEQDQDTTALKPLDGENGDENDE